MAANTNPIFGRQPANAVAGAVLGPSAQGGTVPTQGIDANTVAIFQADITEGGFIDQIRLKPVGSPAATVVRLYLYQGSSGTFTPGTSNTLSNVAMLDELQLAAVVASTTSAQSDLAISLRMGMNPGDRILIGFGTSTGAAGTGYQVTTIATKY